MERSASHPFRRVCGRAQRWRARAGHAGGLLAGAAGLVLFAACNKQVDTPAGPSPTPASAALTGIRLEGPSSLDLGAVGQYRVVAEFRDGSTRDVTGESSIWSHRWNVLRIDAGGVVAGIGQGEADIWAAYPAGFVDPDGGLVLGPENLRSGTVRVLVLEAGTFRVKGLVTEAGRPFSNVRVAVVAGKRAGLTVSTSSNGEYAMYGLAGATELAVTEEGHQKAMRSIVVTDHQIVDFDLAPLPGYDTLSGDWRFTISASPDCGVALPAIATVRTLDATITQRGPQIAVRLNSPGIVASSGYSPWGGVSGNLVSISLQSDHENPPNWALLEMLEPRRFLGIHGHLEGQRSGNTVTGWVTSGRFAVYRSVGPNYLAPTTVLESDCRRTAGQDSELHSFRLERK